MIAYCGLDCSKCGAFLATQSNDDALRAKTAEEWSKAYGVDIKPEKINCTGCQSDGVKFDYCENTCEIRKCAHERKVGTCADCGDYACEKLGEFFKMAPNAKESLDSLRSKRG
jgi:hypothetical protein